MRCFDQIASLRAFVRARREEGAAIGFVPTMGALHDGHLSLMKRARSECETVVLSIFVNRRQFNDPKDFERYPREIDRDLSLASDAGVDAVFMPTEEQIHPADSQTIVTVGNLPQDWGPGGLTKRWEGESRPGHFDGVATVCAKLFQIVQPNRAYFGRKDYQQLKVIERMAADLFMPLAIVPCPTVREPDGLAMSSRNARLSPSERRSAVVLYHSLLEVESAYDSGERNAKELRNILCRALAIEPSIEVDYSTIVDSESLEEIDNLESPAVALVAARIGKTRLIDNMSLGALIATDQSPFTESPVVL